MIEFKLQPEEAALQSLADEYWRKSSEDDRLEERAAFGAGAAIRDGDRSVETLVKIVHWKSPRIVHHVRENTPDAIRTALDIAVSHTSTEEALIALQELRGVGIPVASAILTAVHPERYTVIDFRALESLGYFPQDASFYLEYLNFCRHLAEKMEAQSELPAPTRLRALDRALWRWSKKREES